MVQNELQTTADIEEKDVSSLLPSTAIERMARFFLLRMHEAEKEDTTVPALQHQLRDCEKGIENLLNAIQMGILAVSTKERLEQLEQQREALKASILQAQIAKPKYSKEEIVRWISKFKSGCHLQIKALTVCRCFFVLLKIKSHAALRGRFLCGKIAFLSGMKISQIGILRQKLT